MNKPTKTETNLIAQDLRNAGFGVKVREGYDCLEVFLTRKVSGFAFQIERALDQAGYEPCQYSINEACGTLFVRAIVA